MSRSTDVNVVAHARQKIDEEILALEQRIRTLRSSRNELAPIYCLPPEVLTQIFTWVQAFHIAKIDESFNDAASFDKWVQVTHVSRHWRTTAQHSKSLYSTILTHNLGYSKEALRLAEATRLRIIDTAELRKPYTWADEELRDMILTALPQVRTLWLGNQGFEFLLPHLEDPDLPLEDLRISEGDSIPQAFPTSLRCLHLTWHRIESYEWLAGLTNLVELNLTLDQGELIPVDELLRYLDEMPRLTSLDLCCIAPASKHPFTRVAPIKPKLQYLRLVDSPDAIAELLPWLSFTPRFKCTINLDLEDDDSEVDDWLTPVLIPLANHIQASQMIIRKATLTWDNENSDTNSGMQFSSEGGLGADGFIQIGLNPSELVHYDIWWKAAKVLPLKNVEDLIVDVREEALDWEDSPWPKLPLLRRLQVKEDEASMSFLKHFITSEEGSYSSLEELSLHGVSINRNIKTKLRASLANRMESGVKLRRLDFYDSHVTADAVKKISKTVDVVERHGENTPVRKCTPVPRRRSEEV